MFGSSGRDAANRRRKSMAGRHSPARPRLAQPRRLALECLEVRRMLSLAPIISEIQAGNKSGITDTAGVAADWLEIYNPDPQQAANLGGWSLNYAKNNTTWAFPANTILGPGEFRVIFCDSVSATDPVQELHANFNLSKNGSTVSLINGSGTTVSSMTYPALNSDTSYGVAETVTETKLVAAGATASYYAPTSNALGTSWTQTGYNDAGWATGATGLGFANVVNGWAVTVWKSNLSSITNLATAQSVIDSSANQTWKQTRTDPYVNYVNTDYTDDHFQSSSTATGQIVADLSFPGMTIGVEVDQTVMQAVGTLVVPSAGTWTFCANTDDGFEADIGSSSFEYNGSRGATDSLYSVTFPAAGNYPISFLQFQGGGGSNAEFSAAPGTKSAFDSTFRLVGDTTNGGLKVVSTPFNGGTSNSGTFAAAIATNTKTAIQSAITTAGGTSLYARVKFNAPNYASMSALTFKLKYDAGYVAWLNGTQIASANAPASPTWNSLATTERTSDVQATTFQNVDISSALTSGLLKATGNVLAIQVLLSSTTDTDLLCVPELAQISSVIGGEHIYSAASPAAANALGNIAPDVTFSQSHGFYYSPFQLSLTSNIANSSIYYTTDNSVPSATNGTKYSAPFTINTTTVVRAAIVSGGNTGVAETESYIFPVAVAAQPAAPSGFPTTWNGTVNNESTAADYAMSSVPGYTTQQVINALSSLPVMSLESTNDNWFGGSGIYSNSDNHSLEYPGTFEYFDPNHSSVDYNAVVGLQMYGGVGRTPSYKKHSIAILFDQPTGPSAMSYNIFGDGYKPDRLVLRHGFNDGWAWGGANAQYIIDQWTRDALTALGSQNTPGIWVQVFVNGLYWGLYNAVAHVDNNFAAHYYGGDPADYDVYHSGSSFDVVSGDMGGWNKVFNVATTGTVDGSGTASPTVLANSTAYALMAQYLNLPAFCDYIITNYYAGNWDWDWHNFSAIYSTTAGTGMVFLDWDGEGNLQDAGTNITNRDTTSGPTQLFVQLMANTEFRQMFADHIYRDLSGPLSPTKAAAMYQGEATKIGQAIIDESARWGNISGTQYTPANWNSRLAWELGTYFPSRTATMYSQFRTAITFSPATGGSVTYTMYPSLDPPTLLVNGTAQYGGSFALGAALTMTTSTGTIYYTVSTPTVDATDPRASGGGLSTSALTYGSAITLNQNEHVMARILSGGTWSALVDVTYYVNLAPSIRITELMYSPTPATAGEIAAGYHDSGNGAQDFEFVEIQNTGTTMLPLKGLSFTNGVTFTFPTFSLAAGGYAIVASNTAAFIVRYGTQLQAQYGTNWQSLVLAGQYSGHFNDAGEEVALNGPDGAPILDFNYDPGWYPQTNGGGFSLVVRSSSQATTLWNSSLGWKPGGTPNGTPAAAETVSIPMPGSIVVNEVMSHTATAPDDMIEFYNTTAAPINIGGWYVSDSGSNLMKYRVAAGTTVAANGYFVLTEDNNFGLLALSDPGRLAPFALNADGDDVYLSSNYGSQVGGYQTHQSVPAMPTGASYGLYTKPDGNTDFALLQTPSFGTHSGSVYSGAANSVPYASPLTTDEIMYHPTAATLAETNAGYVDSDFEWLEVTNTSSAPVSLANYYLGGGIGFSSGWVPDGMLASSLTVSSITLSGTTATATINSTSTGLQNGDRVHIGGAAQTQYNGDLIIAGLTVNAGAGTTTFTYTVTGSPSSPAVAAFGLALTAGKDAEYETLESGATATWAASLSSASYAVYAHLNLYDGDNNLRSDLDSSAQYTVTIGATSTTVPIDQNQVPGTVNVTSLSYNSVSGLAVATATNHGLSMGSLVHISGATPAAYNGTFVVQAVTANTFSYSVVGTPTSPATGTITAGLNDMWVNLGTYAVNGAVSVQLTRTTAAKPGEWTLAGAVQFVAGQQTTTVALPTMTSFATQHSIAALAPGAYAVIVSNYAAFDSRNHVAANNIPVLGAFSGHLNNGGDTVNIYQFGARGDGVVAAANGFVPTYRVDHVNYTDAAPWPLEPDGNGPALVRVHLGDYGNDVNDWWPSNVGGTPGKVNVVIDKTAPSTPTNLAGQGLLSPSSQISLTWTASTDAQSGVDHYNIYRSGAKIGTAATNSYADTTISVGTNYSYTVTAVNRDGFESGVSNSAGVSLPYVTSNSQPTATEIDIYFNESLTAGPATTLANYTVSGKTVSGVALSRSNTKIALTLSSAMVTGTSYTVTMRNLTTVSGNALPATQTFSFTYTTAGTGTILWECYGGIGGGTAISDLTSASIYPNNPTQTALETSFEAPYNFADNYGERIRGYLSPPITGYYIFTIATDDNGQLWLSTNENPANMVLIAHVDSWTGYRDWANSNNPNQTSTSIYLTAGQRYYVQALQKEGGGGDNLSVRWEIPATTGGAASTWELNSSGVVDSTIPIPGLRLSPPSSTLDLATPPAPANLKATVTGSTQVTLSWSAVTGLTSGVDHYNLYRDGGTSVFATATSTTYVDSSGVSSLTRHSYQVAAVNFDGVVGTKSLAVAASPAGIASVTTGSATQVYVRFTEPVDPATAQTLGNFSITTPVRAISSAVLQADGYTVLLTTASLSSGTNYTLTVSNVKTKSLASLPTPQSTTFALNSVGWNAMFYQANWGTLGSLANAQSVVSTPGYQSWSQAFNPATINYTSGSSALGHFTNDGFLPNQTSLTTEWDNIVISATGNVYIPTAGYYTFDVTSDDGFSLAISGATFSTLTGATNSTGTNTMAYDGGRGTADTFGIAYFATGATYYPISLLWFQGGGGASVEVSASAGSYTTWGSTFHLIGDTASGGLLLGGTYVAPPFSVTTTTLKTSDTSPALSGTITDSTAAVTVRVNGIYYAATNNADGTWTLPRGCISALGSGTYDVVAMGTNSSGQFAFDQTTGELTIDVAAPTATITALTTPTVTAATSVSINFSEPVTNFTLQNLQLTLTNGGVAASVPIEGAQLTSGDNQHWTLANLAGLTYIDGTYQLSVGPGTYQLTDSSGNPLASGNSISWVMKAGTIQSASAADVIRIVTNPSDYTKADVYINNSTSTPTYTASLYGFPQWTLSETAGSRMVVDWSNGNPLPAGGATLNGGSSANGNNLWIAGTAAADTVVMTPGQIAFGTSAPLAFSNVGYFRFDLGTGPDSLTVNGTTLGVNSANAISVGTALTVTGAGIVDLGGLSTTVASLAVNGGTVRNGTLVTSASTVQSGTVSAHLQGAGALSKTTAGVTTLSTSNTYTGSTAVSAGVLVISAAGGLPAGKGLTIGAAIGDDSSALIASPSPSIASSAVTLIGPPPPAAAVASSTATASNQATVFGPLPPSRIPSPTAAVSAAQAQAHDVALLSDFIGPLPPDLWLMCLAAQQAAEKAKKA